MMFVVLFFIKIRMQVFGFIRQEVGRTAAAASASASTETPSLHAVDGIPGGDGKGESAGDGGAGGGGTGDTPVSAAVATELSEKRETVLAELPRLMELNKVACWRGVPIVRYYIADEPVPLYAQISKKLNEIEEIPARDLAVKIDISKCHTRGFLPNGQYALKLVMMYDDHFLSRNDVTVRLSSASNFLSSVAQ